MIHERVDDLPLLVAEMTRMGLASLLDAHFPTHGNWDGLSLGQVAVLWLAHLLSAANHRLSHVQPWAENRWRTLAAGLGRPFRPQDLADDRLAAVLRYLGEAEAWQAFEAALNQRSLRIYALAPQQIRLDSPTVRAHRPVTEGGLFQFGHSKGQPDLPILKLMAATLDPLGLPLVTTVLSGAHADDPLDAPAIEPVRAGLRQRGLLYVGDCKRAAVGTRAFVVRGEDYYLCPLPEKQLAPEALEALLRPVWAGEQATHSIERTDAQGVRRRIAEAFEVRTLVRDETDPTAPAWEERRLVVRSLPAAERATAALRGRLEKALAAIAALGQRGRGKRRWADRAALAAAVEQIVTRYQVAGLLQVQYTEEVRERPVRRRGANPTRTVVEREGSVSAGEDPVAVAAAIQRLGWRVYATHAPATRLSLEAAGLAYREQYQIEQGFGRLKGRPLSLEPMYLMRDDHATGLVPLLSLALRVLCVVEFQVRRSLAALERPVAGLYPGNPARKTSRPSTELLLRAFEHVTLTVLPPPEGGAGRRFLTELTALQQQILHLLDLPLSIYTGLVHRLEEPG